MRYLITILDNTTETSMPFNEFVLYRAKCKEEEQQILIICGSVRELPRVEIPENVQIIYAGRNLYKIRKIIKSVIKECINQGITYAIHMHQVQSAFLAEMAMLGTGFRKKALFTVHSTFSGYKFHNKFLSFVNACFAKRVTCVSNTSYHDYPKVIKKIKGDRFSVIQNGADTDRIDLVIGGKTKKKADEIKVIYVARLIPIKNHAFLLDVLEKCNPKIKFVFVGEEEKNKNTRRGAERRNLLDRIVFTGLIPRNEVFQQLIDADFYISSSTLEGYPVSLLEAMYCGLPLIVSDIPQHKEVAGDCEAITVCPFNAEVWSNTINAMTQMTDEQRNILSEKSRNYVESNFTLKRMHQEYDVLYKLLESM